jgi:LPXTG-motif cell wall-anchored protein
MKTKFSYSLLLLTILIPYVVEIGKFSRVASAEIKEEMFTNNQPPIIKYTTPNLNEVPEEVLENKEKYNFFKRVLSSETIETKNKEDVASRVDYQEFFKPSDYIWSEKKKGMVTNEDQEPLLSEEVEIYENLGILDLEKLLLEENKSQLILNIEKSKQFREGEWKDLPNYILESSNPEENFKLNTIIGEINYTQEKEVAKSQPNFQIESSEFVPDRTVEKIGGKATEKEILEGIYLPLPDESKVQTMVSKKQFEQDLLDQANGLLSIGDVEVTETKKEETLDRETAITHDNFTIERFQFKGDAQTLQPVGEEGINFLKLPETFIEDWKDSSITLLPIDGNEYVQKGSIEDDEKNLSRQWEEEILKQQDVTIETLEEDLLTGNILRDEQGKMIHKSEELTPKITNKIILPYVFDTVSSIENAHDYPESYSGFSDNDLSSGKHVKNALEFLPPQIREDSSLYSKQVVYVLDAFDENGVFDKSKLAGKENVDWEYTHVLNANGSKMLATSENLHELGNSNSVTEVIDGKIYEYWEKGRNGYQNTNCQYIAVAPPIVEFHEHELDVVQDGYNFGIGTLNSWYQLNQPNNPEAFQQAVNRSIASGLGTSGIANGWANPFFNFKKVLDESNPLESAVEGKVTGAGLYRTTVQDYGELTGTPDSEILNDYIYMELVPYQDSEGNDIVDNRGNPVYQWRKFYYTDKEEYYALERIIAYDYGYEVVDELSYSYSISQLNYQTRQEFPLYQEIEPIYSYSDNQYSYKVEKYFYAPTIKIENYSYRTDQFSWETIQAVFSQPYYREKEYAPWYSYLLENVEYSWEKQMVKFSFQRPSEPSLEKMPIVFQKPSEPSLEKTPIVFQEPSEPSLEKTQTVLSSQLPDTDGTATTSQENNKHRLPSTGEVASKNFFITGLLFVFLSVGIGALYSYKKTKKF